jgi:hypothetical protein
MKQLNAKTRHDTGRVNKFLVYKNTLQQEA